MADHSGSAEQTKKTDPPEGWTWIIGSTKWHYMIGAESMCGRWMLLAIPSNLQPGNDESKDNCAGCKRALKQRNQNLQSKAPSINEEKAQP